MSFILDALKKSETERQRQDTPGIANIPESRKPGRGTKWIGIIGALLAINFVVLAAIMLRPGKTDAVPPPVAAPLDAGKSAAAASFSEIVREAKRKPPASSSAEIGAATEPADKQAVTPEPALPVEAEPPLAESLATFNELRADGVLQLPDMHLDIHVYSSEPADRFVFINMTKYRESSTLAEGPLVSKITPEGVVLDYQGRQFLLPRE